MVTIYDLLEVSEDATKEEIEKAYEDMITQYKISPELSEKENKENEFILNKLKMAYEILTNDDKRKKYDKDLAQKRAEDLIKNVTIKNDEESKPEPVEQEIKNTISNKTTITKEQAIKNERYDKEFDDSIDEVKLTPEEQEKLRKAAKEEFEKNLKKAKQAEKEYNEAYQKAYNEYMKKNKQQKNTSLFMVKLKKIRNIAIAILVLILLCVIAWHIPPVKAYIINLYNTNIIFKVFADIVLFIVNIFLGIFKK